MCIVLGTLLRVLNDSTVCKIKVTSNIAIKIIAICITHIPNNYVKLWSVTEYIHCCCKEVFTLLAGIY